MVWGANMNRYFSLILAWALPLGANAFQPFTRHIDGATITVTRSATQPCGVDLNIALTDHDQRMVIIDYSYSGTFDSGTFSGPYKDSITPPSLWKGSRSGEINASMGKMTYLGLSHLTYVDPQGLYCLNEWDFDIIAARTYNASQDQRDYRDELKRKEQARIDEINRRKAEEEERKRKAQQQRFDYIAAQEKARRDNLADYRRSSPENSRCIINEAADIARCEQAKARERADRLKLEADAIQAQKILEAEKIAAAKQAAQFNGSDALYARTRADSCAVAAEQAQRMPQPAMQPNSATAMQQAEAQAQWKQAQAALEEMCRKSKTQGQEVLEHQAEQQRRFLAQQQVQADLNAAIQRGKTTLNEAARDAQNMQNDNADLMNLINRMK